MSSNTQDIDKLREQTVEVASTSREASLQDLTTEARTVADQTKDFIAGLDRVRQSPHMFS